MSEDQYANDEKGQPPLQTLRDGAVAVKLWRQESEEHGAFVSATVTRTYKDRETGDYRESHSLSGADMLRAQALLGDAHREAGKWRQHFREIERQQGAPDPESPNAVAERDTALAQQRDEALANATSPARRSGRERSRER